MRRCSEVVSLLCYVAGKLLYSLLEGCVWLSEPGMGRCTCGHWVSSFMF